MSDRQLCHFCAKQRRTVVRFNLPEAFHLPSGRRKLTLCSYCLETMDTIATDSERNPNRKP